MLKLLLGMLKGLVIGAGVGYGAFALGLDGAFHWITYGAIGALVGFLVGKPIWSLLFDKNATSVIGLLKAIFGFGVGCGLYAVVAKVWGGGPELALTMLSEEPRRLQDWQPLLGGAIGAIYGGFVELDDSVDDKSKAAKGSKALPAASGKSPANKAPAKKA